MTRHTQKGVVLITILVVMALCVTVIVAMTAASEHATTGTLGDLEAAQARALVTAGEASAISVLLADLQNPPEADGPSEAWGSLSQQDIAITGGRFQMQIADQAARFNLNTLTTGSDWAQTTLTAIVAAADLPPEVATRTAAALQGGKPLLQTADLAPRAGLSAAELAALDPFVTSTPDLNGGVNVNSAAPDLLAALITDEAILDRLLTARDEALITTETLTALGIVLPDGLTLRSDVFALSIAVTYGDTRLAAVSTIHRWRDVGGRAHAAVAARKLTQPSGL